MIENANSNSSGFVSSNDRGEDHKFSELPAKPNTKNMFNGKEVSLLSGPNASQPHASKINEATRKNFLLALFHAIKKFLNSFFYTKVDVVTENKRQWIAAYHDSDNKEIPGLKVCRRRFTKSQITLNKAILIERLELKERKLYGLSTYKLKSLKATWERLTMLAVNVGFDSVLDVVKLKLSEYQSSEKHKIQQNFRVESESKKKLNETKKVEGLRYIAVPRISMKKVGPIISGVQKQAEDIKNASLLNISFVPTLASIAEE